MNNASARDSEQGEYLHSGEHSDRAQRDVAVVFGEPRRLLFICTMATWMSSWKYLEVRIIIDIRG